MKRFRNDFAEPKETEVVATFGQAQVVKYPDGRLEIHGGTENDKAQAHDWIKRFWQQGPLTIRRVG